jgi:hypothetical protein
MDEMQLLREMGDATPLAAVTDLAPARAQLMVVARKGPRRRFAVYGASVVGLAAAIFGVFALIPAGGGAPEAGADQVLKLAAAAALEVPDVTPRPDQFIYLKTQNPDGTVREDWLSVDGTHDGILADHWPNPGCRNGRMQVVKGDVPIKGRTEPCKPEPAYRPDLPTDADGMVAYLTRNNDGSLNSTGKDMAFLLGQNYLRPQSRAALFAAAGKIDGLTVDPHAKDAAGRPGIKISWNKKGYSGGFIIDAKTHAYLGDQSTALITMSIVDKAGH